MAKKSQFGITAEFITDTHEDAYWRVTCTDDDGLKTTKVLEQEDFANTLKKGTVIRKENPLYRLGKLPFGYIDSYVGQKGNYKVAVLYEKKKRGIRYFKDAYYVPYPNVLYVFTVKKGRLDSKKAFAVKSKDIKNGIEDSALLYNFPFGNVSCDGGGMCFGNIKLPNLENMKDIDEVVQLFLNGDVNDDLYRPKTHSTKECKQFELYRYLEDKKTFPESILVPSMSGYGADKHQATFAEVF